MDSKYDEIVGKERGKQGKEDKTEEKMESNRRKVTL
jgi:hypothetical protein